MVELVATGIAEASRSKVVTVKVRSFPPAHDIGGSKGKRNH
jgi:hypothetical protein